MARDIDTTPSLTQVLSGGGVSKKAVELEPDFADRMEDGATGMADGELGDGGPDNEDRIEALPADIRADQLDRLELDTREDLDVTEEEEDVDLAHVDGNIRGIGEADVHALRNSGERAAAVADAAQYRPDGPVTAAPTRKH